MADALLDELPVDARNTLNDLLFSTDVKILIDERSLLTYA
jgi:hypothetical protein